MVMGLIRDHGLLTPMCGNDVMNLKAAPPLVVKEADVDGFVVTNV